MPRHLTPNQIESALERSKPVEQFLGAGSLDDSIAWLEISPTKSGYELWHFEAHDGRNPDFIDVYSFSPTGDDWPDIPASCHDTISGALSAAQSHYGALPDRWVNQFVIQDEYLDYLSSKP